MVILNIGNFKSVLNYSRIPTLQKLKTSNQNSQNYETPKPICQKAQLAESPLTQNSIARKASCLKTHLTAKHLL